MAPFPATMQETCRSEGFLLWGYIFFLEVQTFLSIKHPDLNNAKIPLKPSDLKLIITGVSAFKLGKFQGCLRNPREEVFPSF